MCFFHFFSACKEGQLRCDDGVCLSILGWCDGFQECPDASDEAVDCGELMLL